MSETIAVFVNDQIVRVAAGVDAVAAVAAHDAALAGRLHSGTAYLTDGRGIRLAPHATVFPGAILRVVLSAGPPRDETDARA